MHKRNNTSAGFTIVELLIVVVVIAILAAITVVAYTNFQNRANDSAVKHDLNNFAKKVQLVMAESDEYPEGGSLQLTEGGSYTGSPVDSPQPEISFSVSKSPYPEMTGSGAANFIYCSGPNVDTGIPGFAVVARSRSGNAFRFSSFRGLESVSSAFSEGVGVSTCAGDVIGFPRSMSYGYFTNGGGWQSWLEN